MRVLKLVEEIRSSYWFIPSMMAIIALVLGAAIIYIDAAIGSGWLDGLAWYQSNKPAGAQQVLSTIAGSAITVAGVVFSITIVSVSFAASQYGPRVLTNFMGDRGNQVTLGTFIATFLYCLVVLRTIRGGEVGSFVPDLAILVALLLALCSIGVLIFFIHHVPRSIHVNTVVAGIGRQLLDSIDKRFPTFLNEAVGPDTEPDLTRLPPDFRSNDLSAPPSEQAAPVAAAATGYVEAIDDDRLMTLASDARIVLRLRYQPGDFVHRERCFAEIWPPEAASDGLRDEVRACVAVSSRRTALQDIRFLVDELVEVGARALSSGVNDPYTAISCLDWLGAALSDLAPRRLPGRYRADADGSARVIVRPLTFADLVERALARFRPYLAHDRNACLHAFETIREVARACATPGQRRLLAAQARTLGAAAGQGLGEADLALIRERSSDVADELESADAAAAA